jgi:hypothetical protein
MVPGMGDLIYSAVVIAFLLFAIAYVHVTPHL